MPKKKTWKDAGGKRPVAVTITSVVIAVLFFIRIYQAIIPLLKQDFFLRGFSIPFFINGTLTEYGRIVIISFVYIVFAISLIVVLIGFLKMRRWTWVFLMTWVGISLIVSLTDFFYFGEPNYMIMASNVVIAFALTQSDVQKIFGIRSDDSEAII